jgi:hypothetical protein
MMTTESQEIADLFRNPRRRSQPLNTVTSHTYGTSATGEANPRGGGETGASPGRPIHGTVWDDGGVGTSRETWVSPTDLRIAGSGMGGGFATTLEDAIAAGRRAGYDGSYGSSELDRPSGSGSAYGDYYPSDGGMYGSPEPERYEDGMSGSPAPWYTDRGLPTYEYDPYSGGGYDPYDPYAAEDARLASLAAGMPDSTAPSFGSSGVSSAPTSSPSDYYSSPEWLRMLASIQGGLASGAI